MKTTFMRGGLLGLALLAAGGIAVSVTAPAADAAVGHPALTWVYNTYQGGSADSSGCSIDGVMGYQRGWWTDWTCYEYESHPNNPMLDKWELIVTD